MKGIKARSRIAGKRCGCKSGALHLLIPAGCALLLMVSSLSSAQQQVIKAAITGDFVLLASEVTPAMKALRENGIEVTAVHSHMLTENPRLFFMHFWANDDALRLARGLRAALDKVNVVRKM